MTDSGEWAEYYKSWGEMIMLCDYIGNGYYSLQRVAETALYTNDIGPSRSYRMIQWYDVKNNNYINIDTGIEFEKDSLPDCILYYATSDNNTICAYNANKNIIYFLDIKSCSIKNAIEGKLERYGMIYDVTGIYEDDYMLIYYAGDSSSYNYDDYTDYNYRWFLDMDTEETFQMITQYEEAGFEILGYKFESKLSNYVLVAVSQAEFAICRGKKMDFFA